MRSLILASLALLGATPALAQQADRRRMPGYDGMVYRRSLETIHAIAYAGSSPETFRRAENEWVRQRQCERVNGGQPTIFYVYHFYRIEPEARGQRSYAIFELDRETRGGTIERGYFLADVQPPR